MTANSIGTIMIVDDNPQNIKVLANLLSDQPYELIICLSGHDALDILESEYPDLILLDVMMPGMDGYEVCRRIRQNPVLADVPILFLTAKSEPEAIAMGFESGGNDYVLKPFYEAELKARVNNLLKLKKTQDTLKIKNTELEAVVRQLKLASITDPLTGLFNRRYMMDVLSSEVSRFKRSAHPFTLMMCDIDYFKSVNDQYGHNCGDEVLKIIALLLTDRLRQTDTLCRWGGEEFLILLTETDSAGAAILAERMRDEIARSKVLCLGATITVTMTFGIAQYHADQSIDKTILSADKSLYEGKAAGRNRVVVAE